MGIISSLVKGTVKIATLPIAVAKDVGNVVVGERVDSTARQLSTAIDNLLFDEDSD